MLASFYRALPGTHHHNTRVLISETWSVFYEAETSPFRSTNPMQVGANVVVSVTPSNDEPISIRIPASELPSLKKVLKTITRLQKPERSGYINAKLFPDGKLSLSYGGLSHVMQTTLE